MLELLKSAGFVVLTVMIALVIQAQAGITTSDDAPLSAADAPAQLQSFN